MSTLWLVLGSWLLAEFYGYWLHVLLHSDKIRWLSDNHMSHHLRSYPPPHGKVRRPMRTEVYIQEIKENQKLILGLGSEWYIPSILLIGFTVLLEWLLGLSWVQIGFSVGGIFLYSIFMFWWLHDRMHVKGT